MLAALLPSPPPPALTHAPTCSGPCRVAARTPTQASMTRKRRIVNGKVVIIGHKAPKQAGQGAELLEGFKQETRCFRCGSDCCYAGRGACGCVCATRATGVGCSRFDAMCTRMPVLRCRDGLPLSSGCLLYQTRAGAARRGTGCGTARTPTGSAAPRSSSSHQLAPPAPPQQRGLPRTRQPLPPLRLQARARRCVCLRREGWERGRASRGTSQAFTLRPTCTRSTLSMASKALP